MRPYLLHSILFLVCLPMMGFSQGSSSSSVFYLELGRRDASHELSKVHTNIDDERDFWIDQKRFEALLQQQNLDWYQSYVNGKYEIYKANQILCGENCLFSDELAKQSAFYLIIGKSEGRSELAVETNGTATRNP